MAYTTTNPPAMITQRVGGQGAIWSYRSTDAAVTVNGAGYFTDGSDLGMKVGDTVRIVDTDGIATWAWVSAVTAGGAASLTADT